VVFKPSPCTTRWEGVVVVFWVVMVDLLLLVWMARRPIDWLKFGLIVLMVASAPLILHLIYRTWAAFTLEYWIDRDAVTLRWANTRQVIPMGRVQRVIAGGVESLTKPHWLVWPAPYIGQTRALGLLNVMMAATRPLQDCVLLDTGTGFFAVSPMDAEGFVNVLQERYRLGQVHNLQLVQVRTSLFQRLFAGDKTGALLLGAGLVGALLLFGWLMVQFPDLPDALAFHYNSDGLPDVVREKSALFLLPSIGLLAWMINGIWGMWMAAHQQRTGAYMLWGGALIVQVCSLLALASLTH
jgi:hypothetical protein